MGSSDADILQWALREERIVVTGDRRSMPMYLAEHLRQGNTCPGVFIVRRGRLRREIIEYLELAAYAGDVGEFQDVVTFIP